MAKSRLDTVFGMLSTESTVTAAATLGVIVAGAALFEAALIPGVVIGGAAVLAPKFLPNLSSLSWGRRPPRKSTVPRRIAPAAPLSGRPEVGTKPVTLAEFGVGQALAKTITFRIVVTTLDFSANYLVLGELATAAGLSAFSLVVGPVFYFAHEAAWNYYSARGRRSNGGAAESVTFTIFPVGRGAQSGRARFTISRALAKTITFRTIASAMEFTATYVVVGDLATAALLSSFGLVLGPFVYLGHEKLWELYGSRGEAAPAPPPPRHVASAPV